MGVSWFQTAKTPGGTQEKEGCNLVFPPGEKGAGGFEQKMTHGPRTHRGKEKRGHIPRAGHANILLKTQQTKRRRETNCGAPGRTVGSV